MKKVPKQRFYSLLALLLVCALAAGFVYVKRWYTNPDFGKTFGAKAARAQRQLESRQDNFNTCAQLCGVSGRFLQALIFPEVMRYNTLKDGIEAESLRTLYVQFGERYANFSVGLFQMKPGFAETVETKTRQWLPPALQQELQLEYTVTKAEAIREQRVERLLDEEWQLVYLTAFTAICNRLYAAMPFTTELERLQWYATVYNAGFDKTDEYIRKKINQENFYLQQGMPGKKFRYAAIVAWYYSQQPNG